MCGIAGWSLSPTSTLAVRPLSHHLLALSEPRGRDASGWACQVGDDIVTYKRAVPGGNLRVRALPLAARLGILHTRNTTVGDVSNNDNNHPVMSPDKRIALIHNGVVTNHDSFREHYPDLPEVDSAVIPALLAEYGVGSLSELSPTSWAALAWLDESTPGTLHLATTQGAPLVLVGLTDGSMLFASTFEAILDSMKKVGIESMFGWGYHVPQFTYLQVKDGSIIHLENVAEYSFAKARFKPSAKVMTKAEIDRLHHITSGEVASKDAPPVAVTPTPTAVNPPPLGGGATPVSWKGSNYMGAGPATSLYRPPPTRDPNGPNAWASGEIDDIMKKMDAPKPPPPKPTAVVTSLGKRWGSRNQFPDWLKEPADIGKRAIYWLHRSTEPVPFVDFDDFDDFWEALDDWLYNSNLVEDPTFRCGILGPDGRLVELQHELPDNLGMSPWKLFQAIRGVLPGKTNSDFPRYSHVTPAGYLFDVPQGLAVRDADNFLLDEGYDPEFILDLDGYDDDDDDDDDEAWLARYPRFSASEDFARVNKFLNDEAEADAFDLDPPQTFIPTASGGYKEVKK